MSLVNEAAYLYVYAKKIIVLNKKIHSLREDLRKAGQRFHQAHDPEQKKECHQEYQKMGEKLKKMLEDRQSFITRLHRHQVAFAGQLQKEASH